MFSFGTIFGIGNPLLDISAEVEPSFLEQFVSHALFLMTSCVNSDNRRKIKKYAEVARSDKEFSPLIMFE